KPVVALLAKEWRAYRTIARRSLRRVRGRAAATSSQSRGQVVLVACVSTLFLHRLSIASRNRHALQPSRASELTNLHARRAPAHAPREASSLSRRNPVSPVRWT